tara:strand:- start:592 stop:816 length:225 start_codon:yes stop_codon:yes gene_type:complete
MHHQQDKRKVKLAKICDTLKKIEETKKILNYDKIISEVMVETGATKRTSKEYVDTALDMMKRVKVSDGKIIQST